MVCCFVPECKSQTKSKRLTENKPDTAELKAIYERNFFHPPTDPILLEKWRRAIPRSDCRLEATHSVCDLHFAEHLILRHFEIKVGNDLVRIPRDKVKLHADAIPSLFPNLPSYLSKNVKRPRDLPTKRFSNAGDGPLKKRNKTCENIEPVQGFESEILNEFTFQNVVNKQKRISANTNGWISENNENFVSFAKCDFEGARLVLNASLTVSAEMQVTRYYKDINVPCSNSCVIQSCEQLKQLIADMDKMQKCSGNNDTDLRYAICHSKKGYYDQGDETWRGNSCAILMSGNDDRCQSCKNMRSILQAALTSELRKQSKQVSQTQNQIKSSRFRMTSFVNQKIKRLKTRMNRFQILTNHLKAQFKRKSKDDIQRICKDMPEIQKIAIHHCMRAARTKSKGMRYDHKWILSCILLRIKSSRTYDHLRDYKFLPLPSISTLRRYIDVVKSECGIQEDVLKVLERKLAMDADRHGILSFDEMKLRSEITFNQKSMEMEGFVNFGEFTNDDERKDVADHALVFLYRPIIGSWVQTVGMYTSKGATRGATLSKLVLKCILALEAHGLKVDGITCDGGKPNRKMWEVFGVLGKYPDVRNAVTHPMKSINADGLERKLFFFSDYVHLVKCTRNNLLKREEFDDGESSQTVQMKHFRELLKVDEKHGVLRVVRKLTDRHINPTPFEKMNVRLAVQLFSNTTACGLEYYKKMGVSALQDSDTTIKFTRRINRLFDVLNAKLPYDGLCKSSDKMKFLEECASWMGDWSRYDMDRHKGLSEETFDGWNVTLKSTIELTKALCGSDIRYILTSRFSQDPLERFFGIVRQASGCDDHPTTTTFRYVYRLLSVYGILRIPKRKLNIESIVDEAGLTSFKIDSRKGPSKRALAKLSLAEKLQQANPIDSVDIEDIEQTLVLQCDDDDPVRDNVLFYLLPYVVKKTKRFSTCTKCLEALESDLWTHDPQYCQLLKMKMVGKLKIPSKALFNFLQELEGLIKSVLSDSILDAFPLILERSVPISSILRGVLCEEHNDSLVSSITVLYSVARLHWHAKFLNKAHTANQRAKNMRKKVKLV